MASGEPWGCALNLESGNFVVIIVTINDIQCIGVSWGFMGYHGVSCGMYGYVWLWWPQLESVVKPQGSAHDDQRQKLPTWSLIDLEARAGLHGMWNNMEQRFPSSKAMQVGSQLFWDVIPYHTQSPPPWEPPGLMWCGRSVFRFRWTILWLITLNYPNLWIFMWDVTLWWTNSLLWKDPPFLMGKSTINHHFPLQTVSSPEGTDIYTFYTSQLTNLPTGLRGPCETAPWWLLRCGRQCRGRRTSSGRRHGRISKHTLW